MKRELKVPKENRATKENKATKVIREPLDLNEKPEQLDKIVCREPLDLRVKLVNKELLEQKEPPVMREKRELPDKKELLELQQKVGDKDSSPFFAVFKSTLS